VSARRLAAEQVANYQPNTEQWHQLRASGIGGSEVAAILGLSPYVSAYTLWHRKKGLLAGQTPNVGMSWGTRLEDVIAAKFAEDHPEMGVRRTGTWRNLERPWMLGNPDRFITTPAGRAPKAVLEVKTAHGSDTWQWGKSGTDEIPPYYLTQVRWYLAVLGLDLAHVAVLIGGSDYREYTVQQDTADTELMISAAERFWVSLKSDTPPDLDSSLHTYTAVRDLHSDIDATSVEIPTDVAVGYCQAKAALAWAQQEAQLFTTKLADAMGTAKTATHMGTTIATRQSKNGAAPYLVAARNLPTYTETEIAA
jgi:putative phage-type endonuclease